MKINVGSPNMKSMRPAGKAEVGAEEEEEEDKRGREVGWGSSLKSPGVGRSPPEPCHAGELRSGQRGRGNRGVKLVDVVMKRCYRVFDQ